MQIIKEIFYILTVAIVVFFGLELVWPDLILAYFNTNWLLLAWLFVAIIRLGIRKS